jgi:hypothetical protein
VVRLLTEAPGPIRAYFEQLRDYFWAEYDRKKQLAKS